MSTAETGPFVAMAVLCERIDRQPDGTVDVRGIVDGVRIDAPPEGDVEGEPPTVSLMAVVSLRGGAIRGSRDVTMRGQYPSGTLGPAVSRRVQFSDAFPNATLTVPLELEADQDGTYWFDVSAEGRLLTRISLLVQRAAAPPPAGGAPTPPRR